MNQDYKNTGWSKANAGCLRFSEYVHRRGFEADPDAVTKVQVKIFQRLMGDYDVKFFACLYTHLDL